MKVPSVSNVSDKLNAKIVINTNGKRAGSEKSFTIPSEPKAAKNVVPKSLNAAPSELLSKLTFDKSTAPIGIAKSVVKTIPSKIAPRTFFNNKTTVMTKPITARRAPGDVKFTRDGTMPPFEFTLNTPPLYASVATLYAAPLT